LYTHNLPLTGGIEPPAKGPHSPPPQAAGQPEGFSRCWFCTCDCGAAVLVPTFQLTAGNKQSCGCLIPQQSDVTGQRFGKLVVLGKDSYDEKNRRWKWKCQCDCGQETVVFTRYLHRGTRTDCGCMDIVRRQMRGQARRLPLHTALINRVISSYRSNARHKGLVFALSREQMCALLAQECFYCGRPPSTTMTHARHYGAFTYNGIDR